MGHSLVFQTFKVLETLKVLPYKSNLTIFEPFSKWGMGN